MKPLSAFLATVLICVLPTQYGPIIRALPAPPDLRCTLQVIPGDSCTEVVSSMPQGVYWD